MNHSCCIILSQPNRNTHFRHYLLLQNTVKNEDEHPLQGVKYGEEVGHDDCALVDVHQSKRPGQSQKTKKSNGTYYPGSAKTKRLELGHRCIKSVLFTN